MGLGRQQDQAECLHVAHLQQGCSHFLPQMPDPVLVLPVAGSPSLLVSAGPCSATALTWDQTVLAHPCKSKGGFADIRLEGGWCPTLERLLQTWGEADLKRDAGSLGQAPPQPGVAVRRTGRPPMAFSGLHISLPSPIGEALSGHQVQAPETQSPGDSTNLLLPCSDPGGSHSLVPSVSLLQDCLL